MLIEEPHPTTVLSASVYKYGKITRAVLGAFRSKKGIRQGVKFWAYVGILEKKMETTILYTDIDPTALSPT